MAIRQSPILRVCLLVALAAALADAASLRGAKEIEEAVSTDEKETSEDFYQMIIDEPFEEEAEDKEPSLYEKFVEPLFTTHEAPEEGERNLQRLIPQNRLGRRPNLVQGQAGPVPVIGGNFGRPINNGGFINQPFVAQPFARPFGPTPINNNLNSWNWNWGAPAQPVQYVSDNNRPVFTNGGVTFFNSFNRPVAPAVRPVAAPVRTNFANQGFYQSGFSRPIFTTGAGGGGGFGGGNYWDSDFFSPSF